MLQSLHVFFLIFFSLPTFAQTFTVAYPAYPKSLWYFQSPDESALGVSELVLEPLCESHLETRELLPLIASSWKVSTDQKIFTFKLNPSAKFSDGSPVTSEDVKHSFQMLIEPASPLQSVYSDFQAEVPDPQTVIFKTSKPFFKNLEKLCGLFIVSKKTAKPPFLGSGPYRIESFEQGEKIILVKNKNPWAQNLPQNKGRFNFEKILLRTAADAATLIELFKKGEIDYFPFLSAKVWNVDAQGASFESGKIKKLRAEVLTPSGTQGLAFNLRRPLFQDKNIRHALGYLYNRDRFIKELYYSEYTPMSGLINSQSPYHSKKLKPQEFRPQLATEIFQKSGWKMGSNGYLEKKGKIFEFEILVANPAALRHLTLFQEDCKKVGVKVDLKSIDWATRTKLVEDRQFDLVSVKFLLDTDPAEFGATWGSSEADKKGSLNLTGYANPKVDKLAKEIDATASKEKRIKLVQKLEETLADDMPLILEWEQSVLRIAYWDRFSTPLKVPKYSGWYDAFHYWSF